MPVTHMPRHSRLKAIELLLPIEGESPEGLSTQTILERIARLYGDGRSDAARRRAIQRDLKELVEQKRIMVTDPKLRPLSYLRRMGVADEIDDVGWAYIVSNIQQTLADVVPEKRLEAALCRLRSEDFGVSLPEQRFRIVPDTLRLLPAEFDFNTLARVLRAVSEQRALNIVYRDKKGKRSDVTVHPQAALQRGPRLYFFALKEEEMEPVRMYALHRVIRAEVSDKPARVADGFELDDAVLRGQADFGDGNTVRLEALVRGYIADLVRECAVGRDQILDEEPEDGEFEIRLAVTVPSTGQLYRWLLGCGANVKVLAPGDLRDAIVGQAAKIVSLYRERTPTQSAD